MALPVIHLDRAQQAAFTGWAGEVSIYADLPVATSVAGEFWMVLNPTGSRFLLNYKAAGLYLSEAGVWRKINDAQILLNDNQFAVYNAVDNSKQIAFDVSTIATATKRTATWPDKDGTVAMTSDLGIGNYAQTVQSATINTTGEQSIVGSGVGSLSIPGNFFSVGDSFHGKIGGVINATGGGGRSEITINIKTGTTVLASTGVFDLDNATNQGWECELDFTIAAIGATGTIHTNGNFAYTKDGNRSVFGYIFQDVQAIDTTVSNTLNVTVEWNVLNGGDDIYSANFVLYKVF
tara:strand:+ start:39 stop:914 length:876 start_codon:yes stop_codon:yes gene_type:complete